MHGCTAHTLTLPAVQPLAGSPQAKGRRGGDHDLPSRPQPGASAHGGGILARTGALRGGVWPLR